MDTLIINNNKEIKYNDILIWLQPTGLKMGNYDDQNYTKYM